MPRTGPTLCHPKIGYVDLSVTPLSTTWRQRRLSPKYQIQNYTVTLNTIPHTSRNTRCHINIPLRHFVSNTNKPKLHESCSTKSKPYSMLQIKTFFVVLLKKSFVIHLCCLKNIVLEKLTISQTAIEVLTNENLELEGFSASFSSPPTPTGQFNTKRMLEATKTILTPKCLLKPLFVWLNELYQIVRDPSRSVGSISLNAPSQILPRHNTD